MIGDMLARIRKEKGITKTELARLTGINIGHLTHIEKGERNPSHKALKTICKALDIPYQQLMYTYDKVINEEQSDYGLVDYIPYNKIIAINSTQGLIDCPSEVASASFAIRMEDDSMEPIFKKNSYVFVELNSPLNNKDIGAFCYNGTIIIRRFFTRKGKITLKPENRFGSEFTIQPEDTFYIIGKVLL